jgi:hypothetical protein
MATVKDNPTGKDFDAMPDDGKRYLVIPEALGGFRRGTAVSARDLGPGAQLSRLVDQGYLSPLSAEEAAQAPPARPGGFLPPPVPVGQETRAEDEEDNPAADNAPAAEEAADFRPAADEAADFRPAADDLLDLPAPPRDTPSPPPGDEPGAKPFGGRKGR